MVFRAALLLLPVGLFAQTPPPEVDQVLRARVTEFLQDQVDGSFRKAFELVAEDSKDMYFTAPKWQYTSFTIDDITYSDDFKKAAVKVTLSYIFSIMGHPLPVTNPRVLEWQLEDGKWFWHFDPAQIAATPMGGAFQGNAPAANPSKAPPKISAESMTEQAHQILQQSGIDRSEVTLATDKASSDQVIFHNGYAGSVRVVLDSGEPVPGFRAELDKTDLNAGENAVLKLRYEPAGDVSKPFVTVRLTVVPFNRVFPVAVKFASSSKQLEGH